MVPQNRPHQHVTHSATHKIPKEHGQLSSTVFNLVASWRFLMRTLIRNQWSFGKCACFDNPALLAITHSYKSKQPRKH